MDSNLIVLGLNASALIWGAATVRQEVRGLRTDLRELTADFKAHTAITTASLADHGSRLGRVEGRLGLE